MFRSRYNIQVDEVQSDATKARALTLTFYLDEDASDKRVARSARARDIQIVRCVEAGMQDASDPEHMVHAAERDYVLVSRDSGYLKRAVEWWDSGRRPPIMVIIPPDFHDDIDAIVRQFEFVIAFYQAMPDQPPLVFHVGIGDEDSTGDES